MNARGLRPWRETRSATKMQHLEDAVAALSLKLGKDELKALAEPYKPHPVLGNLR